MITFSLPFPPTLKKVSDSTKRVMRTWCSLAMFSFFNFYYLSIWLHQFILIVVACGIFSCGMWHPQLWHMASSSQYVCVCSVMSDIFGPIDQPTRLLCPWNFPGKNTGVPFLITGYLSNTETESVSLASAALAGRLFTTSATCEQGSNLGLPHWEHGVLASIHSMDFSRPQYWSGQPFPSPGHLPNPEIGPRSPTLQVDSLPAEPHKGSPRILE